MLEFDFNAHESLIVPYSGYDWNAVEKGVKSQGFHPSILGNIMYQFCLAEEDAIVQIQLH